ncbi:MAG: c-type cytochrome [Planctomycetes bacterium]|nr:c-type cytochrome [Planctomycetota bacterium]
MKWARHIWIYLVGFLALLPAGLRALTWQEVPAHDLDGAAVAAGKMLFTHEWTPNDPLSPRGDGLGPVFNAVSCVACHEQGGLGGSGGFEHNVTMFTLQPTRPGEMMRSGVVHSQANDGFAESLKQVHADLPDIAQPVLRPFTTRSGMRGAGFDFRLPTGIGVSQRNTPALFGARLIDEITDRDIIAQERKQRLRWGLSPTGGESKPVGRALRLADGRIGRFGWKAQSPTLLAFVQAACANELGLGNPGQPQPRPLGRPDYQPVGLDLTDKQCRDMTTFIASLPKPVERAPEDSAARHEAEMGRTLFMKIGCADCHTPDLGSAEGIYSDLLLHRMGPDLEGGGFYYGEVIARTSPTAPPAVPVQGPLADEWRTPPLWGVADSAPYLHDGRAATLPDAIQLHGGQGAASARAFSALAPAAQAQVIAFLKTLQAP